MKKIISIIVALVAVTSFLGSCVKDDTNFDYPTKDVIEAGEIVIDTTGTDRSVFYKNWDQDSTYRFQLKVKYNEPQNLRYTWLVVPYPYRAVQVGNTTQYPQADTICTTLDLDFTCALAPGDYTLYFVAEDTVKGISQSIKPSGNNLFHVNAKGAIPSMVYCLEEMPDGTVDIDIFGTSDALIYSVGHNKRTYTTLQPENPIQGKPLFMAPGRNWYYIVTDKEFRRVSPIGWTTMELGEEMFYQAPEKIKPEAIMYTNSCEWLVNDSKLYCINNVSEADRKFPAPIPGEYQVLPYLAKSTMTSWGHTPDAIDAHQIVIDNKAKAIRPYFAKASSLSYFKAADSQNAFNYNSMPNDAEVVYASMDMGGTETLVITKEPTGYWANVACFYNVVDNGLLARRRVSMEGIADFDKAQNITNTGGGSAIYWNIGNKFYAWAYGSGRTAATLVYEFPSNEQITAIKVIPGGGYPSADWCTWIATWDETAKDGKVYEIFLDPVSGDPALVWGVMGHDDMRLVDNGFGKIVSFCCP